MTRSRRPLATQYAVQRRWSTKEQHEGDEKRGKGHLVEVERDARVKRPVQGVGAARRWAPRVPSRGRAKRNTGTIDAATRAPWAMRSVRGSDQSQYSGARTTRMGWKWSPRRLLTPLTLLAGASRRL